MSTPSSVLLGVVAAALLMVRAEATQDTLPRATAALTEAASTTPIGWLDLCRRYPDECGGTSLPSANVRLTQGTWALLKGVNDRVNEQIEPVTDQDHWGTIERWDYPSDGRGDCEDYVLLKRKLLIEAGLPRQALLITVVRDRKGDGHAVLTVTTDRGDFVLNNQEPRILPWTETGHRFAKRQSQDNPNRWVMFRSPTAVALAAR